MPADQRYPGRFPEHGGEAFAFALAFAGVFVFAFSFLPGNSAIPPALRMLRQNSVLV
jgi:hypothetical protein